MDKTTNKEIILDSLINDDEARTQIVEHFKFVKISISDKELDSTLNEMLGEGLITVNKKWKNENGEYPYSLTDKGKRAWQCIEGNTENLTQESQIMIEFKGELSENCKNYILKNNSKNARLAALIVCIPLAIIDIWISISIDLIYLIILPVLVLFVALAGVRPDKKTYKFTFPNRVTIEEAFLLSEGDGFSETRTLAQVTQVIDYGEWYKINFSFPNKSQRFVCQKDLLTFGRIEEFEDLFHDKLMKKLNINLTENQINYYIEKAEFLSKSAEELIESLPTLGDYLTDDIANEWLDEEKVLLKKYSDKKIISEKVAILYSQINDGFNRVSLGEAEYEPEIWTLQGLKNHPFWERQRQLARQLCEELHKIKL